jgi:hypothetical protein
LREAAWLTPASIRLASLLLRSHRRAFHRPLLAAERFDASARLLAQELFACDTVVLAHDRGEDPRLIYANRAALRLWRRCWREMVGMPSRLTAEPAERGPRAAALGRAGRLRAIEGYGGVRIDRHGGRFRFAAARIWTLQEEDGAARGQAACFNDWWRL